MAVPAVASSGAVTEGNSGGGGGNGLLSADADLLRSFREGDREALARVYRAYVGSVAQAVNGSLRRYGYDEGGRRWRLLAGELPDLVQEVFMRAFEPGARRRFDGIREYGPYLGQIARNVVVDFLRRKRRQVLVVPIPIEDAASARLPSRDDTEAREHSETVALVGSYVARLPPEIRRVHEALYVAGMSQREAAEALGLGRQVIRTLESRLREGLRDALSQVERLQVPAPGAARPPEPVAGDERVRG
jgi:RNA polymerase sigma-70 factor, ECF subfamily